MLLNLKAKYFFFPCLIMLLLAFSTDPVQKKIIRTKEFDIEFYVSLKQKRSEKDRDYYWYRAGEIHHSFGNSGGPLLHQEYVKYYVGHKLAEKGEFEYGLKKGVWKQWYPNGNLKEECRWVSGVKFGSYNFYNEKGKLSIKGKFRNNIKTGVWVNQESNDTIWHKKGKAFNENPRIIKRRQDSIDGKEGFFKRIFGKRDSIPNQEKDNFLKRLFAKKPSPIKENKIMIPKQKKSENIPVTENKEERPGFFQRMFGSKKQKDKKD